MQIVVDMAVSRLIGEGPLVNFQQLVFVYA